MLSGAIQSLLEPVLLPVLQIEQPIWAKRLNRTTDNATSVFCSVAKLPKAF